MAVYSAFFEASPTRFERRLYGRQSVGTARSTRGQDLECKGARGRVQRDPEYCEERERESFQRGAFDMLLYYMADFYGNDVRITIMARRG